MLHTLLRGLGLEPARNPFLETITIFIVLESKSVGTEKRAELKADGSGEGRLQPLEQEGQGRRLVEAEAYWLQLT